MTNVAATAAMGRQKIAGAAQGYSCAIPKDCDAQTLEKNLA